MRYDTPVRLNRCPTSGQCSRVVPGVTLICPLFQVSVRALGIVGEISVWWHVTAGTAFVLLLPLIAPTHQSAAWVFTTFAPDYSYSGINSGAYMFLLGLLGSQWAMVGYDAAAHMAEETEGADLSGECDSMAKYVINTVKQCVFL